MAAISLKKLILYKIFCTDRKHSQNTITHSINSVSIALSSIATLTTSHC